MDNTKDVPERSGSREPQVNADPDGVYAKRQLLSVRAAEAQFKAAHTNARIAREVLALVGEQRRQAADYSWRAEGFLREAEIDLHLALAAEADGA